jgi:hypothetical protein
VTAPLVTDLAAGRMLAAAFLDSLTAQAMTPCVRAREVEERDADLVGIARLLAAAAHVRAPVTGAPPDPEEASDLVRDSLEAERYLRLRYRQPALSVGQFVPLAADGPMRALAFARRFGASELIVIVNAGDSEARIELPERVARTPLVPIFASRGDLAEIPSLLLIYPESGGTRYAHPVPARTAVVFRPAEAEDVRPNGLHE